MMEQKEHYRSAGMLLFLLDELEDLELPTQNQAVLLIPMGNIADVENANDCIFSIPTRN